MVNLYDESIALLDTNFNFECYKPACITNISGILSEDVANIADRGKFSERELNEIYTKFLRENVGAFMKDWSSYTKLTVYVDLR